VQMSWKDRLGWIGLWAAHVSLLIILCFLTFVLLITWLNLTHHVPDWVNIVPIVACACAVIYPIGLSLAYFAVRPRPKSGVDGEIQSLGLMLLLALPGLGQRTFRERSGLPKAR
jgi:hypothetical protein